MIIDLSFAIRLDALRISRTHSHGNPAVRRGITRDRSRASSGNPARPRITITVRRHGTRDDYSGHVAVAAGGKGSAEHQADILVQTHPVRKGWPVSPPVMSGGGGMLGVDAVVTMDAAKTDAVGRIFGHYTSSDRVGSVTLRLNTGSAGGGLAATIDQRWNDAPDGSDWPGDVNSPYFDYDAVAQAEFAPRFWGGDRPVPITGHRIAFVVTQADIVTVRDNSMPVSTSFQGAEAGLWAYFSPAPATEARGAYWSTLLVPAPNPAAETDSAVEVESVSTGARDEDVFAGAATGKARS